MRAASVPVSPQITPLQGSPGVRSRLSCPSGRGQAVWLLQAQPWAEAAGGREPQTWHGRRWVAGAPGKRS